MPGTGSSPSVASLDETLASAAGTGGRLSDASFERGDLVGRYVVLEDIGRGAMGLVVAAYDPELDRKVALKLVRIGPGASESSSSARARLIREAQAMARLAHPNVITIHDVGTADDDVFIAMEYVDGGSLREWLARERPRWQQIVASFIQAGEGLAAAHAQGIVHRDFKPDNVLVRLDGRVGVADFGLARRDDTRSEPPTSGESHDAITSTLRDSSVDALGGLTMTGATLGTPAYMAPEQHLRTNLDHRCDQFAFCVALWEALVGRRPYAGKSLGAIALNVTSGKVDDFPRDSPVPSRIRVALQRGLRTDPDARFPGMGPLLDELRAALRADRRRHSWPAWAYALVLTALVCAALIAWALTGARTDAPPPAPRLCAGASEHMIDVWDDAIKAEVERVFARSERPFARRSFTRAAATLDELRAQWMASHTAACEATRVHGEQSEDMLDRKMTCLARRRGEILAVSSALQDADDATIEGVDGLLATIAPIADCEDLEQLGADLAPPPADRRDDVESLRDRLADLEVRRRVSKNTDAKAESAQLLERAEALGYAPIIAEILNIRASIIESADGPNEALEVTRRAMAVAAAAGHRRILIEAMALLGWIEGVGRANYDLGLWLLDHAEAEARALGDPIRATLQIRSNRGAIRFSMADYDAALREFEAALAFARERLGDDHVRVADLRFNIAGVHQQLGHYELAEQAFRLAVEQYTEMMGPEHPEVAQCRNNLAVTLISLARLDEAEQHTKAAIEIWEADGGHSYLPGAHGTLGEIAVRRGDYELARAQFERAYLGKREIFGEDNPMTLMALASLANVEHIVGLDDQARAHYEGGLTAAGAAEVEHPTVLELRVGLCELEISQQGFAAAQRQLDAIEAGARAGELPSYLGVAKLLRAIVLHARGREREAASLLDEAEPLLRDAGEDERLREAAALRAKLDLDDRGDRAR